MADGCIHVLGVTASLVALTALLIIGVKSQTLLWVVSLAIYGLALVATFSFSAGYHLVARPQAQGGPAPARPRRDLPDDRRHLHALHPDQDAQRPGGFGLLAVVWTMAAIGIAIKLFAPRFLEGFRPRSIWCRAGRCLPRGSP